MTIWLGVRGFAGQKDPLVGNKYIGEKHGRMQGQIPGTERRIKGGGRWLYPRGWR